MLTIAQKRLRDKFQETRNPNHRLYLDNGSFSAILYQACRYEWPPEDDLIHEMLEAGAQVHNGLHTSPIFEAVDADNPSALAWLHQYGARLDPGPPGPLPWRYIPLHQAAFGRLKVLEWLAAHGVDLDRVDTHGRTALHIAAGRDQPQALKILIDHGARLDLPDNNGIYPLRVAAKKAKPANLAILIERGAASSLDDSQWADLTGMADTMYKHALGYYQSADSEWLRRNHDWADWAKSLADTRWAVLDLLLRYRDL